jgi:hypothetical protein
MSKAIVSCFEWLQNLQSYYWIRDEVLAQLRPILDKAKAGVEYQKRKMRFSRRLLYFFWECPSLWHSAPAARHSPMK